jgi:endonuclease III
MSKNTKHTSSRIAKLASETLQDTHSSQVAKSLAASALSQRSGDRQTGAKMEDVAARVLSSDKYASETKELAASVLVQANKQR